MNGQYYLIKHVGTQYKFYWAPLSPAPLRKFEDWGIAVIDVSWETVDPRPRHLRAKPLSYALKPAYQILRDPRIDGQINQSYRRVVMSHVGKFLTIVDNGGHAYSWAAG